MNHRHALLALSAAALLSATADAADLRVPKQFPTIQAAVDSAAPGDKIRISDGVYDELVTIEKSNLTLKGDDDVLVRQMVVRNCQQVSLKEITFTEPDFGVQLTVENASFVDIRFCSFVDGFHGIQFTNADNATLRDSDLINLPGAGFVLDGDSDNCRVSKVAMRATSGHVANGSEGAIIEDSVIKESFVLVFDALTTIRGNAFKKSTLQVFADNVLIDSNSFKKSPGTAIEMNDSSGSTVQLNAIKKPQGFGIALDETSDDNVVFANAVKKAAQIGILVEGEENVIDQNVALKSKGLDLFVSQKGENTIGFNVVGSSNL